MLKSFPNFLCLLLLALIASGSPTAAAASGKAKVIATISILGDWTNIVGGDDVELTTLVGPDADPHSYEPTPDANLKIADASLIIENGLGLETWLDKLYSASGSKAARAVLTDGVEVRHAPSGDRDPHAWQNVKNAVVMVGHLRDALAKIDPAHADAYRSRAQAYIDKLNDLDTYIASQIATIPPARRKLVTSHDAFGYFGQRYGIAIVGSALESMTTEAADPSAGDLADVIDRIRSSGVPVIFLESMQNPKLMNQIAAEAHVRVGPRLYTDALGKAGSDGETYLKMMRFNTDVLVKALK